MQDHLQGTVLLLRLLLQPTIGRRSDRSRDPTFLPEGDAYILQAFLLPPGFDRTRNLISDDGEDWENETGLKSVCEVSRPCLNTADGAACPDGRSQLPGTKQVQQILHLSNFQDLWDYTMHNP